MNLVKLLSFCFCAVLLSGCAATRFTLPENATLISRTEMLNALERIAVKPDPFYLRFTAIINNPTRASSQIKGILLSEPPSNIRVEIYPSLGAYAIAAFSSNAEQARAIDTQSKTAIVSGSSSYIINKFCGFTLTASESAALMIGKLPASLISNFHQAAVKDDVLTAISQNRRMVAVVVGKRLSQLQLAASNTHLNLRYGYPTEKAQFPNKVEVFNLKNKSQISLEIGDKTPLPSANNSRFQLTIPTGYRTYHQFD